jgi:hypothetical protein
MAKTSKEKKPEPSDQEDNHEFWKPKKWSLGILNDTETDEVPGSQRHFKRTLIRY